MAKSIIKQSTLNRIWVSSYNRCSFNDVGIDSIEELLIPVLRAFKQFAVGSNLEFKTHLGVHDRLEFRHDGIHFRLQFLRLSPQ